MSLEFEDDVFDAAICVLVLNLLPDAGKALSEMKRVERPDGTVASYVWDISIGGHPSSPMVNGLALLDPEAPGFGAGGARKVESEADIVALFEQGELDDIDVRKFEISVRYASFDDYWEDVLVHQGPPGFYIRRLGPDGLQGLRGILMNTLPGAKTDEIEYPAVA